MTHPEHDSPHTIDDDGLVEIDIDRLIATRLLCTANSGGGKGWFLRRILEQTFGKVQHVVFDPEGEFHTLRESFDYVLVGPGGDIPAIVEHAHRLAQKILGLGCSVIIDLSELAITKDSDGRAEYIKHFLEGTMQAHKSLWHEVLFAVDEAHLFCLDDQTELLTNRGWVRHADIQVGDIAVAFNLNNSEYRYEPVQRVIRKKHDGAMVTLRTRNVDCLVTPDHRTVIRREQRAAGRMRTQYDWTFCDAKDVPTQVSIPSGGAPVGSGVEISDDLLRLIGWVVTDGCFSGAGKSRKYERYLAISQSSVTTKRGKSMLAELDRLTSALGATSRSIRPARKTSAPSVVYYLGESLSSEVLNWTGTEIHRVPRTLLLGCSKRQLEVLFESLFQGDGTAGKDGNWVNFYAGMSEGLADDIQEIALRLGLGASKRKVPQNEQWTVGIAHRRHSHRVRRPGTATYVGDVWCITVPSGAFVARRNGKVFVTGNCPEKGVREATSTSAVLDLMTRGRKRGFCGMLATQRLSELHKSAAAECNNRLVGRTVLDVDQVRAAKALGMAAKTSTFNALKDLDDGEFYVVGPALSRSVQRVTVGATRTHHHKVGSRGAPPTPAPKGIKRLLAEFGDIPKEAAREQGELERLRAEVERLSQDEFASQFPEGHAALVESYEARLKAHETEHVRLSEENEQLRKQADDALSADDGKWDAIAEVFDQIADKAISARNSLLDETIDTNVRAGRAVGLDQKKIERTKMDAYVAKPARSADGRDATAARSSGDLSRMERRLLTALAQLGACTRARAMKFADYRPNGHVSEAFASFIENGWVASGNGMVAITEHGKKKLGTWEPLPTGRVFREHIFSSNAHNVMEKKILAAIVGVYPKAISRAAVMEHAGYRPNGHVSEAFAKWVSYGYVEKQGRGLVVASKDLF